MTSVVDTSVKFFSNQMAGAPGLPGIAGALISLLDACLKDGFDLKTLSSLTVAGGVATAAYTGNHSAMVDSVVLIAGVTGGPAGWAGLNGEQKITGKPNASAVTFATNLPDGTYTGTITMKIAPLGWLRPFAATNVATYKSADPTSTGMTLRVDDTGATFARVVGYEAMSDVNTGVGPFPSPAQMPGGGYWPKSSVANATAVPWLLVGDSRGFYLWVAPYASTTPTQISGWVRGFGDMVVLRPGGDAYACGLNFSMVNSVTSMYEGVFGGYGSTRLPRTATPRTFTGLGSSALHWVSPYTGSDNQMSGADLTLGPFPSKVDGQLKLSSLYLSETTPEPRAEVPGLYSVPQTFVFDTFKHLDRAPGTGPLAGRSLLCMQIASSGITTPPVNSNSGALFVDVTGPWPR